MSIDTINPATGEIIRSYDEMSDQTISSIIQACHQAHLLWKEFPIDKRLSCFTKIAELLLERKVQYAKLIAEEMGKPVNQGEAEIEKCAKACMHYLKHSAEYLKNRPVQTEMKKSYITYQPLGVIFAIMPWNFPFWQVFRFAIPNLIAGNGAILKHAPISTGTALAIEGLFQDARFIPDLFRSLVIQDDQAKKVIQHPKIAGVTLTGSQRAGKIVAAEAAHALKKSVLELGGNDPYLILEDADLEKAAEACVTSRMNNSGQVCIAAKRLILVEAIEQPFIELLMEKIKRYKMGDPLKRETNFGPLARQDLRDKVHAQVQKSIEMGAQLMTGGIIPDLNGFYYPPTLLTQITQDMPAYKEEIFGPVLATMTVSDEEKAIELANDSDYGLSAAIFSQDLKRATEIAETKIQTGTCAINTLVASDSRLPFGGIKGSGYGRELAEEGMHSFLNIKTIHIMD